MPIIHLYGNGSMVHGTNVIRVIRHLVTNRIIFVVAVSSMCFLHFDISLLNIAIGINLLVCCTFGKSVYGYELLTNTIGNIHWIPRNVPRIIDGRLFNSYLYCLLLFLLNVISSQGSG